MKKWQPDLEKIKSIIEKCDGNRKAISEMTGYSHSYVSKLFKKIKKKYPEWKYFSYKEDPNFFPSNHQRLSYLDNPEVPYYNRTKRPKNET